jgi:hypothetical protein
VKVLIILLVVVAVLFLIAVALGASHGSRRPDDPSGVGFLKGLQGSRFLTLGDKASTTCPVVSTNPTVLSVPAATCVITVEKRSLFSRPTRVAFDAGAGMTVTSDTKSVPNQQNTLPTDGRYCYGSAVAHGGGTITLAPFSSTTITLRTAACPPS